MTQILSISESISSSAGEQRFRALVCRVPVGIFISDAQGRCLYVNDLWCELTGMALNDALGEGWTKALHPDDRERVFAEWNQAAAEGQVFSLNTGISIQSET